jgi:hypothetical protein
MRALGVAPACPEHVTARRVTHPAGRQRRGHQEAGALTVIVVCPIVPPLRYETLSSERVTGEGFFLDLQVLQR